MIVMDDIKALLDIATQSMDWGSGFLDHEEVEVLRRVAISVGVDPSEVTPYTFRASFAHDYQDEKVSRVYGRDFVQPQDIPVCGHCRRIESNPVHHGISTTRAQSEWATGG